MKPKNVRIAPEAAKYAALSSSRSMMNTVTAPRMIPASVAPAPKVSRPPLVDRSSSDPIRWRPRARPRTEARHRRQDHARKGLTHEGPLQKPVLFVTRAGGLWREDGA